MEERLTKKERKEQRKLEELKQMEKSQSSGKGKFIVIALAIILFLGFGTFAILGSKKKASAPITMSSSGWVTGNPNSKVTVVEFADFQCPACLAFKPTMDKLRKDYGGKVKIVFKHFPLKQAHPNALSAGIASEAAGRQNKFWEYHDLLYENQQVWSPLPDPTSDFLKYAKDLKLDIDKFKKDLKDKALKDIVNAQSDEGIKIGVNATPTIYINGEFMGVPRYEDLKKKIDEELARFK